MILYDSYFDCTANNFVFYFISLQDLACKKTVEELKPEVLSTQSSKTDPPQCLSLAWSTDGQTLFAGYSDNTIRVWQVSVSASR